MNSDVLTYFEAARLLRTYDPATRRPAVRILIDLARGASDPIRTRSQDLLVEQFGPYAGGGALPGCVAPISEVQICDEQERDCRLCPWLWLGA